MLSAFFGEALQSARMTATDIEVKAAKTPSKKK